MALDFANDLGFRGCVRKVVVSKKIPPNHTGDVQPWQRSHDIEMVRMVSILCVKPYPQTCFFSDTHVIQPQNIRCCVRLFFCTKHAEKTPAADGEMEEVP